MASGMALAVMLFIAFESAFASGCKNILNLNLFGFGFDASTCGAGVTIAGVRGGVSKKGVSAGVNLGVGAEAGPVGANAGIRADVTVGKGGVSERVKAHASAAAGVGVSVAAGVEDGISHGKPFAKAGAGAGAGIMIGDSEGEEDEGASIGPQIAGASASAGFKGEDFTAGASAHAMDKKTSTGRKPGGLAALPVPTGYLASNQIHTRLFAVVAAISSVVSVVMYQRLYPKVNQHVHATVADEDSSGLAYIRCAA